MAGRSSVVITPFSPQRTSRSLIRFSNSRTFPRPGVGFEPPESVLLEQHSLTRSVGAVLPEEVLDQEPGRRPPARAGAEDRLGETAEPVVQVVAKPPACHLLAQRPIGGGDQPHVDSRRLVVSHPHDLAALHRTEQLRLNVRGGVCDLVEEQAAAVGEFERTGAIAVGTGERAADMSEQLGLDEIGRNGTAVERKIRTGRTGTVGVQTTGNELLAGTALAVQVNRVVARSHLVDDTQHLVHLRAAGDDGGVLVLQGELCLSFTQGLAHLHQFARLLVHASLEFAIEPFDLLFGSLELVLAFEVVTQEVALLESDGGVIGEVLHHPQVFLVETVHPAQVIEMQRADDAIVAAQRHAKDRAQFQLPDRRRLPELLVGDGIGRQVRPPLRNHLPSDGRGDRRLGVLDVRGAEVCARPEWRRPDRE